MHFPKTTAVTVTRAAVVDGILQPGEGGMVPVLDCTQ